MNSSTFLRCASVSRALGSTTSRSRAIWSAGVVVVRPHPGQANPGQSTQAEGSVCVRPAAALNDWIRPGPPTAFHRLVAAELSLSSIIRWASD